MTIIVNREVLLEPLIQVCGIVERRQTLPILANILVQCSADQMILTATDLEVEITTSLPVKTTTGYETTLPARKLLDICKALPVNAQIEIEMNTDRAELRSGRGRYFLGMLPANDYPAIDNIEADQELTISEGKLARLIQKVAFAMAQQDVRYYLNGMLVELSPKRLRAVATDGHRLALSDIKIDIEGIEEEKRLIMPRKAVLELGRMLSLTSDENVTISLSTNHVRFTHGATVFTTKLIDGKFPDYERVVPAEGGRILEIQRDTLKDSLHRASILSNEKYRGIRFTFSKDILTLNANNLDQEEAEETVEISYSGEDMSIGFNVGYVIDVLGVIDTDNVHMAVTDQNSSVVLSNTDDSTSKYVIMPMRL